MESTFLYIPNFVSRNLYFYKVLFLKSRLDFSDAKVIPSRSGRLCSCVNIVQYV